MKLFKFIDLVKENNTLRLEKEELENLIKTKLFNSLIASANEDARAKKLIEENKQLRKTIRKLREGLISKECK